MEKTQQINNLSEDYQTIQRDLQSTIQSRQQLESQLQENKEIQREFANLANDANIYKMVGPVLLKQEKSEAVVAVDARVEFINNEIKKVEDKIKELSSKSEAIRVQIPA
ncbi:Prefoldin subunit [Erysiphe necator]|uniref:Putative prefoldin subunit 6 n=1 Tax=Uncinula necator TaxID=52586 RepID=A0A0B1P8C9_UNCNE|nr:Prefoldin subunit [Erysiphe necator]KHJ32904.1 putative prefoldin subunit 6 [Erysiphe necator]